MPDRHGTTSVVIAQVDDALRQIVVNEALEGASLDVVFDAPTREWAARRNAPTINLYLYDIREDLRRRPSGYLEECNEDGVVILRRPAPRFYRLSYLATAWTKRPEDEHQLLDNLLRSFLRYDALPAHLVVGQLADPAEPVPLSVGLPPAEGRVFADVWQALGGELKPSLDLVVVAPMWTGREFPVGPTVDDGVRIDVRDMVNGGEDVRRGKHVPPAAAASDAPATAEKAGDPGRGRR